MMTTGWDLFNKAQIDVLEVERACVRFNDQFGEIPVAELESWLQRMPMFISYEDPTWQGFPYPGRENDFRFQIWTSTRIYFTREIEGIVVLSSIQTDVATWLRVQSRPEKSLTEIGSGREWSWGERQ